MGLAMLDRTLLPPGERARAYLATESRIHAMSARRGPPSVASMDEEEAPMQRVKVDFVGAPPIQQVERASGVCQVEIDGSVLRCVVCGSFQPFLEALRGYEVTSLQSTLGPPTPDQEES
jgi:hypothetical protein